MNKSQKLLLAAPIALAMSIGVARADENTASLGLEIGRYSYKEEDGSERLMDLRGPQVALSGKYFWNFENVFTGLEGRIGFGVEKYRGSMYNWRTNDYGPYGSATYKDGRHLLIEPRFLIGFNDDDNLFNVYSGLAYRFKADRTPGDESGLPRKSNYVYIPVGVALNIPICDIVDVRPFFEYDYIAHAFQKHDVKMRQKRGYGMRGGIDVAYDNWAIGPYFNYWNVKKSNTVNHGYWEVHEPANKTTEVGLKIAYKF